MRTGAAPSTFAGGAWLLDRGVWDQARLTWRLLRDPRVSILRYAIPAFMLAYLMSPIDAIPDVLLGIGHTDDLGIAVLAIMLLVRIVPKLAPADVVDDHVRGMGLKEAVREREASEPGQRGRPIEARFNVRR